jgi:hypothetical protein
MSNRLKMAIIQAIVSLHAQGWTQVRIAESLQIDRGTVRKYLRQHLSGAKPANAPTGSVDELIDVTSSKPARFSALPGPEPKAANAPIGAFAESPNEMPAGESAGCDAPKPANLPTGSISIPGPISQCEAHRELIAAKLAEDLSYQRIQQDLAAAGVTVHYDALRRFCRRIAPRRMLPVRRMECLPGEEAQVDFGTGAPIVSADGNPPIRGGFHAPNDTTAVSAPGMSFSRGSRASGFNSAPNSSTISRSRSGSNTVTDSESEPSAARGHPSRFCTLANSLACCKPRNEVTIGLNKYNRISKQY